MTASTLEIRELQLWYGAFHALRGIDLSLHKGQFLALLGPSGCGKTSLLRSVAGFAHPQAGSIHIGGRDVIALKPRERNLGMVFQHYALFPHMTAAENVAFGLKCRGTGQAETVERVTRTLDMVGLGTLKDRKPRQLSGGQQQRVALARALVIEPEILLLDEPLGALDRKLRIQMQTELQMIQKRLDVTSVFVTHDQEEAMAMADVIAIMRDGEIEQIGAPAEIFTAPRTRWAAEFVGAGNVVEGRVVDRGDGTLVLQGPAGCDFRVPGVTGGPGAIFVSAEKVRLLPAEGPDTLEVAAHRYLGVHVEVQAMRDGRTIRALLAPEAARGLAIGARVRATAEPQDCRQIA